MTIRSGPCEVRSQYLEHPREIKPTSFVLAGDARTPEAAAVDRARSGSSGRLAVPTAADSDSSGSGRSVDGGSGRRAAAAALAAVVEVLGSVTTARCNGVECCRTEAEDVHSLAFPTHNTVHAAISEQ